MSLWVQSDSNDLASVTWYKGDEIEYDANYLWPFNPKGTYKSYMEVKTSSSPLYIQFTPDNAVNLQGVILSFYANSSTVDYDRDVTVELEESTDSGTSWTSVRSKTLNFPNDISMGPEKQYGMYMIDFRFSSSYVLNTSYLYRFKIYRGSGGFGTVSLLLSKDASFSSWTADVSNYAFRIIYSDTTGTPTSSDVFVITNELTIKQNWTVGYITIPTSPTKYYLNSYNNKPALWFTSKGRLYIPSSITSDITVEIKGRMYIGGGDRVVWQIGDSEASPIPSSRTVNWYFNCEGVTRRAGIYGYRCAWAKIEHYGAEITNWYGVLKEDASAGQNQIVIEGDVTGSWQVGDKLRIGGTRFSSTRNYVDFQRDHTYYEISALSYDSGNDETTITLTSNLACMREATGRVLLIRRNVNIYGDNFASVVYLADFYVVYLRWWRSYWVRSAHLRYPVFTYNHNSKISLDSYPHTDILKGLLLDNCFQVYLQYRKGGQASEISACDSRSAGWYWGEGNYTFHRCQNFTITNSVGLTQYYFIYLSQSANMEIANFWIQSRYPLFLYLTSNSKIHNGVAFNSRFLIQISGSSSNEIYDINAYNIYYDSNNAASSGNTQGCFFYANDMLSQDNYIHDVSIENAFCLFAVDTGDGCDDWYHNVTFSGLTTEIWDIYREDWMDATKIRFTKKNGIENNDWIIYKYGMVHRTGDYTSADDTLYRSELGGSFALRLEPQITGQDFEEYKVLLTGAKTGKPVNYTGYLYVKSGYFDGSDYAEPEIYLDGCGIDYSTAPSAKWQHPGSGYAGQWVSFNLVGTPTEDGDVYAIVKLKSDGSQPYCYIDDDIYTWADNIDWRGHEVWINGNPSYPPAQFPNISALEIWNQATQSLSTTVSIGRVLAEHSGIIAPRNTIIKKDSTERIVFCVEEENVYSSKIKIYSSDGSLSVESAMTKLGNTRYYYYDWTPSTAGIFVIECFVENYIIKDARTVQVLESKDWYATYRDICKLNTLILL